MRENLVPLLSFSLSGIFSHLAWAMVCVGPNNVMSAHKFPFAGAIISHTQTHTEEIEGFISPPAAAAVAFFHSFFPFSADALRLSILYLPPSSSSSSSSSLSSFLSAAIKRPRVRLSLECKRPEAFAAQLDSTRVLCHAE